MSDLLEAMRNEHYGEQVTMLDHSLQTAAVADASGADDALVIAALLHDVGHMLGDAGQWGYPGHAELGASWLSQALPSSVTEPIRLHVDAKRYLVATQPDYLHSLSEASIESLHEQGGPFSDSEARTFADEPFAEQAVLLRRWDDDGKTAGLRVSPFDAYRQRIDGLMKAEVSPSWARDACRCQECRDPFNGQRLFDIADLGDLTVVGHSRTTDTQLVTVQSSDGSMHECKIPLRHESTQRGQRRLWGSERSSDLARHRAGELDDFCSELVETGIALIAGLPTSEATVLDFADEIGFVRNTNYGDLFDVRSESQPTNLAYSAVGLPLHTDNPYRDPVPTVQLLHCLRPASAGGASVFADGFYAAEVLRAEHPEDFEILATTLLAFRFTSADVDLRAQAPTISLDVNGSVDRITVNNRSMETPEPGPHIEAFYSAYRRFIKLLASSEVAIELTLAAGELVGFDNRRVLHGRSAYEADPNRHLQGCYIDIDALRARL